MRKRWLFPASLCVLAVYIAVCAGAGEDWIAPRRQALSIQLSPNLTGSGLLLLPIVFLCLTALLGRWYCTLLCPAGTVQELFSRIGAKLGVRRLKHVSAPRKIFLLALVGLASVFGLRTLAQITDPIGLFGRLMMPAAGTFPPAAQMLTWAAVLAGAMLLIVLPLFRGRVFCDRFCPVGALLGVAAAARKNRPVTTINRDKCVVCKKCARVCPVQCVDAKRGIIEPERCLDCGACARACPCGAIERQARDGADAPGKRRNFLTSAAAGAAGIFFLSRPASGVFDWESPAPCVTPPGTVGDNLHRQHCVGCQACVAACPMHIIQTRDGSDLRPVLDYDRGFCHYNCRSCLESCPAGAFDASLTLEERQRIRVARVGLELPRCVAQINDTACGACAEVCPTHALQMVERGGGKPSIPDFAPAYCIGCGACYHACPAEPRAFTVQGLAKHETAAGIRPSIAKEEETAPVPALPEPGELTDFPF